MTVRQQLLGYIIFSLIIPVMLYGNGNPEHDAKNKSEKVTTQQTNNKEDKEWKSMLKKQYANFVNKLKSDTETDTSGFLSDGSNKGLEEYLNEKVKNRFPKKFVINPSRNSSGHNTSASSPLSEKENQTTNLRELTDTEILKLKEKAIKIKKLKDKQPVRDGKITYTVMPRDIVQNIHCAIGYTTVLRILNSDIQGKEVIIGGKDRFEVNVYKPVKDDTSITSILITPLSPFVATNLIIFKNEVPYFYNLIETYDKSEIDYSIDAELSEIVSNNLDNGVGDGSQLLECLIYDRSNEWTRSVSLHRDRGRFQFITNEDKNLLSIDCDYFNTRIGYYGYIVPDMKENLNPVNAEYYTRYNGDLYVVFEEGIKPDFMKYPEYKHVVITKESK